MPDFSALPAPLGSILPLLFACGLGFAASAAVNWLRGRARIDLRVAAARIQDALKTKDTKDDAEARRLYAEAQKAASDLEAVARAIESLPIPKIK